MNDTLEYLTMYARFPIALRRFLQHPLTLDEAKAIIRERMDHREESFLKLAERSIYGCPRSPYLALLKIAGCELGDLRGLVQRKGLEGALRELREAGVYVTYEEFKGRKPMVRDGHALPIGPRDFDNPFVRRDFTLRTAGSTGLSIYVGQNLEFIAAATPHRMVALAAHGVLDLPMANWGQILPGRSVSGMLEEALYGHMPERFFSSIGWHESKYWLKYDLATYYMLFWMRLHGVRAPWPEYVSVDQALVVAHWVHDTLREHRRCLLFASPSRALRVCIAAQAAGLDLTGAVMRGGGEPVTPAKVEVMRRVGVRYIPGYGMTEAGSMAVGCAQPSDVSDVHLFQDALALITFPHVLAGSGVTVPAFNLTTILENAPIVLLNFQIDDYGVVEERHCGCELEKCGYSVHLRDIHSYSKLVGEGVTLIGNEMLHILDQVLPARFGGSPLDYQLREEEDAGGLTRLYLIISPRVDIADEQAVIEIVLRALGESSPMADAARTVWQQAQTIRIKREEPILTPGGKLLPLHLQHRARQP
jgi:hypothetical protein